jgi:precorrin-6B methylase 2
MSPARITLSKTITVPECDRILTIEGRDTHAALGQENIDQAKLKQTVELKCGRAADILKALPEATEPFDFIHVTDPFNTWFDVVWVENVTSTNHVVQNNHCT